ncbi:hypothetical protein SUGI_1064710 [Cryptomeria japonica]|uniref:probable inactive receptor kinase At2g26730 n=1 Tax=Cryptomeria japonica TaxID=3369 RepID=UPI002414A6B2|nr:probable inactive receptor kinase At2g26730 [Cryptomeria japonica]GLJ50060.1 hypothetical protein SUGI_1064710 [Cryptomeria japonica]
MRSAIITPISLAVGAVLLIIVIVSISCYRSYKNKPLREPNAGTVPNMKRREVPIRGRVRKKPIVPKSIARLETVSEVERGKLLFLNEDDSDYDLEDLLQASAEMLGGGNFGNSYKAVLKNGSTMVVKRLKDLNNLVREEFEEQMEMLSKLRHENLVPWSSCYYTDEEKLLVYEYMPNGNLFDLLHGAKERGRRALDWKSRVKVAVCIARGLTYLHDQWPSRRFIPHGNIKSSNVLIDKNNQPRLSDYGLTPFISSVSVAKNMVAFKSPEYFQTGKLSRKSDVWSFGILLLELLTGKIPSQYDRRGTDLSQFVQTVVREEWTGELFDKEVRWQESSQEMLKMLSIAMDCTHTALERRPVFSTVLRRLEEIEASDAENSVSDYESSFEVSGTSFELCKTPARDNSFLYIRSE